MTREQKYDLVNDCETLEELADVIKSFADENDLIQGRTRRFNADTMVNNCLNYSLERHNTLTREFGIRQQAMYILFYENL